ncbi:MAG: preprotein translocase subunit Sec61beta, partial [Desulfurococcaceae archaeon]
KKKRTTPSILSAAGLVRFYEEVDVGIKLQPHVLILITIILVATIIILSKLFPPII